MKIKQKHLYILGTVVVLAIAAFYFLGPSITGNATEPDGDDKVTRLAQCLTENGAVLYGTRTCPHCANQKKMFGDAVKYIDYVECTEQLSLCTQKGIRSVPAWEIDGKFYVGERALDSLATLAGCPFE
jgi:glutaredoxin